MFFSKEKGGFLVAGLGNPGAKYENTRHNAGFAAIDAIARELNISVSKKKFSALCGEAELNGQKVHFIKPQTYMNLSGEAVSAAAKYYKIPVENIIVIFDDVSLEPGKMRIRRKGAHGGHNGIKSIISCLQSEDFPRVKLGVGAKPHKDYDLAAWVLSQFGADEKKAFLSAADNCLDAIELITGGKIDKAMNKYNS